MPSPRISRLLQLALAAAVLLLPSATADAAATGAATAKPADAKKAGKKRAKKKKLAKRAVPRVAAAPPEFFGLTDWALPSNDVLERQADFGLRSWRIVVDHGAVSSVPGQQQFGYFDNLVAAAAQRGITFTFTLTGCPTWSCTDGRPPTSGAALDQWLTFVSAAVSRYGANGSFWVEHPALPPHPVEAWQIFNEINGADQWPDPSPEAYAAFLATTSQAIRGADPGAKVVVGGLAEKMTIWMKDYMARLYAQPGFAASFDVMAIEGYALRPADIGGILDTARTIMNRAGDVGKPIWVTEMSWSTGGPAHPFTLSEQQQASNLRASWAMLAGCRTRWNLQRVFWFGYQDKVVPEGGSDYWGYHNGLVRLDGSAKPALAEADGFARRPTVPGCTLPKKATAARKRAATPKRRKAAARKAATTGRSTAALARS